MRQRGTNRALGQAGQRMAVLAGKGLDALDLVDAVNLAVGQCANLGIDVGLLDTCDLTCGFGQGDVGVEAARIDVCVELP